MVKITTNGQLKATSQPKIVVIPIAFSPQQITHTMPAFIKNPNANPNSSVRIICINIFIEPPIKIAIFACRKCLKLELNQ